MMNIYKRILTLVTAAFIMASMTLVQASGDSNDNKKQNFNPGVNRAPVLLVEPPVAKNIMAGDTLTFEVSARDDGMPYLDNYERTDCRWRDDDNDYGAHGNINHHEGDYEYCKPPSPGILEFTARPLPAGASFSDENEDGIWIFSWTPVAADSGIANVIFTVSDGKLEDSEVVTITVTSEVASCAFLADNKLDETGITCPADGSRALVCNMQLDEGFFGINLNDHCCICNQEGQGSITPLEECDPNIPAGSAPVNGVGSCFVDGEQKQPLEVTTFLEFNNDPYYCYTSGGRRVCFRY